MAIKKSPKTPAPSLPGEGKEMSLTVAIKALNESSKLQIVLQTSRDGRVTAVLPRVGRKIIIEGSPFNQDVKVTAADLACLCEEARRACAPGMSLLEAGLTTLSDLDRGGVALPKATKE